jgi:RNA polymerase sigma factor (sigma-70 family)
LTDRLRSRVVRLTPRERDVLDRRFGLDGSTPRTLRQTGRELGISRERVRQIELRTLLRLRDLL